MTDWQLKLNIEADRAKGDPEAIKILVKKYINDFAETLIESKGVGWMDKIEEALIFREVDYDIDLFY